MQPCLITWVDGLLPTYRAAFSRRPVALFTSRYDPQRICLMPFPQIEPLTARRGELLLAASLSAEEIDLVIVFSQSLLSQKTARGAVH